MAAPVEKKPPGRHPRSRRKTPSTRAPVGGSEDTAASLPEPGLTGEVRVEAGPAFSAAKMLQLRGLNVLAQAAVPEKEKVSITLDKSLVDEIRGQFGGRALSASINELLYAALAQERLGELVDRMEEEAGAASPEAYDRVLAQWFAG